jgi:hypothetical protein
VAILVFAFSAPSFAQDDVPKKESARPTVILMDLQPQNISPEIATLATQSLGVSFEKLDVFEVRTAGDVQQALDVEMKKEAMGCDAQSCLAEIAGALGADYVAYGTVGSLGNSTLVTVNLYHHAKAKSLGRQRVQVVDRAKLPELMDQMVADLLAETEFAIGSKASSDDGSALSSPLFWTGTGAFVLGAAGATGLGIGAGMMHNTLTNTDESPEDRSDAKGTGELLVIGAAISGAVAAVGIGLAAMPLVME